MKSLTRRSFVAAAAGACMTLSVRKASALIMKRSWGIEAEGSFEPEPYAIIVNYSIDSFVVEKLYLEIRDVDPSSGFYLWIPIEDPAGEQLFRCGGFDVPEDATYRISIVTADGHKHPLSPEAIITVEDFPDCVEG